MSSEFGVCPTGTLRERNSEFGIRSTRARETLRYGIRSSEYSLFPSENGAYKVRPQVTHTAPPLREREKLRNGVTILTTK